MGRLLIKARQKAAKPGAEDVIRLRYYLLVTMADCRLSYEVNHQGLTAVGAVEVSVNKLLLDRMKKRGMSWAKKGVNGMLRLVSPSHTSRLDTGQTVFAGKPELIVRNVSHTPRRVGYEDDSGGTWLPRSKSSPHALHSDHPWLQALGAPSWRR